MDREVESIYNKNLSITALIGFFAFGLLSFRGQSFSSAPLLSAIIFITIIFVGYFLTSWLLHGQDSSLFILSCFVTELGLIVLYRLNPELFLKQIMWFSLGVTLFIVSCFITRFFVRVNINSFILFIITAILLISPLLIGVERGGSKSWIAFKNFDFQPSELAKIIFSFFLAKSLENGEIPKTPLFFAKILFIIGILAISRDMGGAFLFYMTALVVIFAATSRWDIALGGMGMAVVIGALGYFAFGHVRVRFEAWLNPWKDVPGKGYQIVQSLFAIAEGGFLGTGLGMGNPEYIPAVTTDFIFSAFAEEFGFLGAIGVIMVYFILLYRGIRIALWAKNSYQSLLALGITSFFGFQIFTIIGGVIKLIPLTGVTLPFMSYGGSSMVMSFISLGILNGIWLESLEDEVDEES